LYQWAPAPAPLGFPKKGIFGWEYPGAISYVQQKRQIGNNRRMVSQREDIFAKFWVGSP
jgi:hypothetical protein